MDPPRRSVGLTVSALYKKSNRQIIDIQVETIIKDIDARISTAHEAGFNTVVVDLPVTFAINNMSKGDAQILIYSMVLDILTRDEADGGKGFNPEDVKLQTGSNRAALQIKWLNGMDHEEKKQRIALISKFTQSSK
jgi:hypothetical protein